jgi:hypothetical protein
MADISDQVTDSEPLWLMKEGTNVYPKNAAYFGKRCCSAGTPARSTGPLGYLTESDEGGFQFISVLPYPR